MKSRITNKINKVYFDCNGTTPVLPGSIEAVINSMDIYYGNPSSTHSLGLQSKYTLNYAREMAAQVIGAEPEQIIFMSGATEAIHTAIFSVLKSLAHTKNTEKNKLLYGATEHKAISQALQHWVTILGLDYKLVELPVDENGQIIIETLKEELPQAALICTMAVNNETGVIQNLSAIEATLLHFNADAYWLVDCVQALGKLDLELNFTRIDYAVFSGHKIYAPKGIGFLYKKTNAPYIPLIVGGGQEKGFRSGTENLSGIAGMGYILKQLAIRNESQVFQSHNCLSYFRDKLITVLKEIFPKIQFNTPIEQSIPTTLNFSIPGLTSQELLDVFDAAGLHLSGGSACNSASLKPSHVLQAMGKSNVVCISSIRLSFGLATTLDEIELGCILLRECGKAFIKAGLLENKLLETYSELYDGILQFPNGANNSWMIVDKVYRRCVIVDPCEEVGERIEQYVKCQNLVVVAILDTHNHADHQSIRPRLEKKLESYFSEKNLGERDALGWPEQLRSHRMITLDNLKKVPALFIGNTSNGELVLAKLQTPGHTSDSMTFLLGSLKENHMSKRDVTFVFSGDMILGGGLGRTNFATSSSSAMYDSLKILDSVISRDTLICPAHDYNQSFCTSLNTELQSNPMMALVLETGSLENKQIFIDRKMEVDLELSHLEENFQGLVCGVTDSAKLGNRLPVIFAHELKGFFNNKPITPLVIDVSEKQEFFMRRDWFSIGIQEIPLNIPLSRLPNLIRELLILKKFHDEILFICKSGERSLLAALALGKFGFNNVRSLEGGFAVASLLKDQFFEPMKLLESLEQ